MVPNCQNVQSQECRDEIVTKVETQCNTIHQQQCRNITEVKYVTQKKEVKISIRKRIVYQPLNRSTYYCHQVVERECREVPDQECRVEKTVVQNPVNTTECREVQQNKCKVVTEPITKQECKQLFLTKNCRKITEKVTEIVNEVSESIQLILKSIFLSHNIQPILQGRFFLVNPNNKSGLM